MGRFQVENSTPVRKQLNGIVTGVGASNTAVLKIPTNATYAQLMVRCTIAGVAATRAELSAMLNECRVSINGRLVEALTVKQMIAINEFYNTGITADTGFLTFDFGRLWMLGFAAQNEPEWGTLYEPSFEIQIDQTAASTIDLIRVYAEFEPSPAELGMHIERVRVSPAITAIGNIDNATLPKPNGAVSLYALHIETSVPANLTDVRVVADNVEVLNLPVAVLNRHYLRANPRRTVQSAILTDANGATSGFVHIDFACRNYDSDALKCVYDSLVLTETFAAAAPTVHNIIMEFARFEPSKAPTK